MTISSSSSNNNHLFVDDFYFSALHDKDQIFPISDELYAEELQFQEALMSSSSANISSKMIKNESATPMAALKEKKKETGESSQSFCFICMDAKPKEEMFKINKCNHTFCNNCTANYVASKIKENVAMVKCPVLECQSNLEPQICRPIIPKEVYDRWEDALSESFILGSQKFYCPFKDCSAMLVDDGGKIVTVSECPICHRMFCAQCKVPWHVGLNCEQFQKLGKGEREMEDLMLLELAKNKKWMRCPKCKFYVEKSEGCMHISCRCGFQFCYGCGSKWSQVHVCRQV